MRDDCLLPPSQAHIWGPFNGCHGWAVQSASAPEYPETEAQRNGLLSRKLATEMIASYARGGLEFPERSKYEPEVYDPARTFADDVRFVMQRTGIFGGPHFKLNHFVKCAAISEYVHGHIDCAIYDEKSMTLTIWIYTTRHTAMETRGSMRGVCYFSALFEEFGINGKTDQTLQCYLRIVQPNAYLREGPITEWYFPGHELRGYENILRSSAEKALSPVTECRSGEYCPSCDARFNCDAAYDSATNMFSMACTPMVNDMNPVELARRYALVKKAVTLLGALDTAYTQQVESMLRSGKDVPGLAAVPKYGKLDWTEPVDSVVAMGDMLGVDLRKNGVKTPTQAIAAMKAIGLDESTVMGFATRKQTGFEIVPASEITTIAKEIFA